MKNIIILILIILFPFTAYGYSTGCSPVSGGTCYLCSADKTDISNAIAAATAGDTIRVGAGSVSVGSWTISKNLYIMGAAAPNAPSAGTTTWVTTVSQGLKFTSTGLTRFAYSSIDNSAGGGNGAIEFGSQKRMDHLTVYTGGAHVFKIWNLVTNVVIDNCDFSEGRGISLGSSTGYTYWENEDNFNPGTIGNVYIEDCTFGDSAVEVLDSNGGGSFIVRGSTFNGGANIAAHGADSGLHSGGFYESYSNTFNASGDIAHVIRGGTAFLFNNTDNDGRTNFGKMVYQRSCWPCGGYSYTGENASRCGDGTEAIDGYDDATGWLCKQQPGTGPNDTDGGYPGSRKPIYIWENTASGSSSGQCACGGDIADHVKANRDYYIDTGGQLTKATSAPTTCSTQYDAVWYDTDGDDCYDDGISCGGGGAETLYQCDGANYQVYYTPYTYPHPLRGESTPTNTIQGVTIGNLKITEYIAYHREDGLR